MLTLLTRAYCHLCDDMRTALAPLAAEARMPSGANSRRSMIEWYGLPSIASSA